MRACYTLSWIPSLMVIVGLMFISSCKDDEKPKANFSFAEIENEVFENDGIIEVTVNIDRAVSETVVLSYTIEGTATEFTPQDGGDFSISPDGGYLTIAAGATSATFEIELFEDGEFEFNQNEGISYETIILTLTSVVSGPGKLGTEGLQYTLNVYEDDMIVFLDWVGSGSGDVDMDILFWFDSPTDNPDGGFLLINPQEIGGANPGTESEAILLLGSNPDADYGFSYVYYEGTNDDLAFTSTFVNFAGSINGAFEDAEFTGNYKLVNLNPWDQETGTDPHITQTMTKAGYNYTVSALDVPETGSRKRISGSFNGLDKLKLRNSTGVKKIKISKALLDKLR